jgi:cytochrome c oxidase subunit 3
MTTQERAALGEPYSTLEQQRDTAEFGMWIFLATEVMLFGGLLTAYTVYRTVYPAGFAEGSRHLDLIYGGPNTAVLLLSSLTMAQAVHSAQSGERRKLLRYLIATALIGLVFMGLKGAEYYKHYLDGMVPLMNWHYDGPYPAQVEMFFFAYFALTGLHAVHLTIGITIVLITAFMASRGAFPPEKDAPVEVIGLYWHFVDVVWIFLLPLLYLFGLQA